MAQARAVLDLGEVFAARLAEVGAAELLRDVELPTSALLARMERHGIAADRGLAGAAWSSSSPPRCSRR